MFKRNMLKFDIPAIDYSLPIDLPMFRTKRKGMSVKQAERFHRKRRHIPNIIKSRIDPHEIVYGARALNKRFPPFLDKYTQDYDIYTPHPKRDAKETERALDRRFGGDFFYVEQAQHLDTQRVKAHADGSVAADYTRPDEPIPFDTIDGIKYVKLSHVKKRSHSILQDPSARYRHDRERDVLNRIKIYERMKK